MPDKYSQHTLKNSFIALSILIVVLSLVIYAKEVSAALAMDPNSYNCTSDSMMKQICQDPYGSSLSWTLLYLTLFAWPLLFAWAMLGIMLLRKKSKRSTLQN